MNEELPPVSPPHPHGRLLLLSGVLAVSIVSATLFLFIHPNTTSQPQTAAAGMRYISLDPHNIQAQAAIIFDPQSGEVLFDKNSQQQLPLASLTKLMTAQAALEEGLATGTTVISRQAVETEGDSKIQVGEKWQLADLIKYGLLVSSNDAMAAIAESGGGKEFLTTMNTQAKKLGLAQSYFLDPTGLDLTPGVSGGYGSARDVATLAATLYKKYPSFFESTLQAGSVFKAGSRVIVANKATAQPILDIPGLIGAKTGYTELAGGNLMAAFDVQLGYPLIAVVLHSTAQGRFSDMRTLITAARATEGI